MTIQCALKWSTHRVGPAGYMPEPSNVVFWRFETTEGIPNPKTKRNYIGRSRWVLWHFAHKDGPSVGYMCWEPRQAFNSYFLAIRTLTTISKSLGLNAS